MLSRTLRFAILLAVIAAVIEAVRRLAQPDVADTSPAPTPWTALEPAPGRDDGDAAGATETAPTEKPPAPAEEPAAAEATTWVDADADGTCPASHPLKAKDSSKIVHQPGGLSYERTHADRCYADLTAAEADGYRAAKR